MEMFVLDEEVVRLEGALLFSEGQTRLEILLPLLSYLRQRDPQRTRNLVQEAQGLLRQLEISGPLEQGYQARMDITSAEIQWLVGELESAQALARRALQLFAGLDDAQGCADVHWLQAWIAFSHGNEASRDAELALALLHSERAGDLMRIHIVQAQMTFFAALSDSSMVCAKPGELDDQKAENSLPVIAIMYDYRGVSALHLGEFGNAIALLLKAFNAALLTGQVRRAIISALNIGESFNYLNNHQAAMEWGHRALHLARTSDIGQSMGSCLSSLADTLRHLGQLEAARQMIDEASLAMYGQSGSHNHNMLLCIAADLALESGESDQALLLFEQLRLAGEQLAQKNLQIRALSGIAQAFALQEKTYCALEVAQQALELARQQQGGIRQIDVLRILAGLDSAAGASLAYLQQALHLASNIEGYAVSGKLYQALAREYARQDDYEKSYLMVLKAEAARAKLHDQQVLSRANAMQAQFQIECARAESDYHLQLAQAEAMRVRVLEQISSTMAHVNREKISVEQVERQQAEEITNAKSDFLVSMIHEIRTPMNAITGMVHLALRSGLSEKQLDYMNKIERASASLLLIINDMLDLSKIEAGQLTLELVSFSLDDVLTNLANLCSQKAAEKKLHFDFDIPVALPRQLLGDPLRLGQVLLNLVNNAIKFTEHGEVVLRVRQQVSQQPLIEGQVHLCFDVIDSGIGMSEFDVDRLFVPFTQAEASTSRKYGGTGLGLSISQHLVHLMGGEITVQSTLGQGACFSFELNFSLADGACEPSWEGPPARVLLVTTDSRQRQWLQQALEPFIAAHCLRLDDVGSLESTLYQGARVLLAEDNEFNQQLVVELLSDKGVGVDVVHNGQQALDQLLLVAPDTYQMVLMDLEMPVLDGEVATRALRQDERFAKLPVVAMTAHALLEMRERCLAGGMQDYITKPIDLGQLNQVLARWLPKKNRRSDLPEVVATPPTLPMMHLPGIDIQLGLSYAAGKQDLYHSMLRRFYETRQDFMTQLQAHLSGGERQEVLRLLHTVRGICGSIGAKALVEAVQAVESYLSGDGNTLPNNGLWHQHLAQLQTMFDQVFQGLALYFGAQMEPAAALASSEPECVDLTGEGARVRLGLLDLLQQSNAEALAYFARNQATLSAVIDAARMQELRALLDNFEFETACELLQ